MRVMGGESEHWGCKEASESKERLGSRMARHRAGGKAAKDDASSVRKRHRKSWRVGAGSGLGLRAWLALLQNPTGN